MRVSYLVTFPLDDGGGFSAWLDELSSEALKELIVDFANKNAVLTLPLEPDGYPDEVKHVGKVRLFGGKLKRLEV